MAKVFFIICTTVLTAAMGAAVVDHGGCTCAVFPEDSQTPIMQQSLNFNVTCDEEGNTMCQNLCIALAQGAKDKASAMICEMLNKHVENLKVAVFAKSCLNKEEEWKFTGLKNPEPICCHEGKETLCGSLAHTY